MDPIEARRRLRDFLLKETDLHKRILIKAAKKDLESICRSLGDEKETFTNAEIKSYISANYTELNTKAKVAVEEICKNLLPEKRWIYLTKQFAIISALLLPALVSLSTNLLAFIKSQTLDTASAGMCLMGILTIVIFLLASASFYLKNK